MPDGRERVEGPPVIAALIRLLAREGGVSEAAWLAGLLRREQLIEKLRRLFPKAIQEQGVLASPMRSPGLSRGSSAHASESSSRTALASSVVSNHSSSAGVRRNSLPRAMGSTVSEL
jgi:hypothetical protein